MKENPSPVFELDERTRRFQRVLDNVELPIWYSDRDLVYRVVNRPYAQMFGVDETQLIGLRGPDVIGAELFRQIEEHVIRVLQGVRVSYEREAQWRGRGRRRIRLTLFPDARPSGEIDGMYGVVCDIEDDHRLRDALHEREMRLMHFADHVPEPLIYFDRPLHYAFANRAFLESRNMTHAQVVGRTVEEVRGPEFAAELRPLLEQAFVGRPAMFERLSATGNGEWRWTRTRLTPDFAPDGSVAGVYAVIIDIDELKCTQEALGAAEKHPPVHRQYSGTGYVPGCG